MTPDENKRINDWLKKLPGTSAAEGEQPGGEMEAESSQEWEIQSVIDTLLQMQEKQLSLSDEFHERLQVRMRGEHIAAEPALEVERVMPQTHPVRASQTTAAKRRSRWWYPTVVAALVVLLVVGWQSWRGRYPEPQATGSFQVVGGGPLRADSSLVTKQEAAQVVLGGYCNVQVEPNSRIQLAGDKQQESVTLQAGSVVCEVERGQGKFTVVTDLGTVSVVGTKFEVGMREGEGNMISREMFVKVLVGTVIVTHAAGQTETLHAGEQTVVSKTADPFTQGGYRLVWADEFEKDGAPDPENWTFEEGFVRNNEDQWYQKENAQCKNGMLVITGREDIKRNPNYVKGSTDPAETKFIEFSSSSLMTKGLHQWTMGRFVMRAKIPHGEGMWPAFWAVGEQGEWPSCGEIDMMEYYQNKILANVASGTQKRWNARWSSQAIKTEELGGDKWLDEFHVWRMDWDTESIRLYVDDKLLNETKLANTYNANPKWGPKNPFHHPHYLIVNLALGGNNGGEMEKATLPAEYVIDYVRVYQRDQDRNFKPADKYTPPPVYQGKRVGIHHFSELPKTVNKKCSWEKGADSRCYAWKPPGSTREAAQMSDDHQDKVEGELSYKFVLNHGWSRWVLEMDPEYGDGVADLSEFETMGFAMKSKDAAAWEKFRVIIDDAKGNSYEAPLASLGFKPDGKWHRCQIDLSEVKKRGVDLTQIKTLFAVGWEGGVRSGQFYRLDDLYVE